MRIRTLSAIALLPILSALAACGESPKQDDPGEPRREDGRPPDHIAVDHILIGVRSQSFPTGRRNAADAKDAAYGLLAKLQAGGDWAAAKRDFSEDPPPGGPYRLANHGVPQRDPQEFPRAGMVPAFGDVGFALAVGEIGIADFDPKKSPFGYHLIKRVE